MLVLEGLVGLHRTANFSFFSTAVCGTDLDYCDIEWFALKTNRSFYHFWNCIQVLHFGLFCWLRATPFLPRDFAHSGRYNKVVDITKVHLVKAMFFLVVTYGYESWTVKKAERWRIDAFELWYWRRLLSPLDCKEIKPVNPKGDQSWIFIGRTDAELKLQYLTTRCKEPTHWERPWCWERSKVGEGVNRGWDGWMASLMRWTWVWVGSGSWWWTGILTCCSPGISKSQTRLSDWTDAIFYSDCTILLSHLQCSRVPVSPCFC